MADPLRPYAPFRLDFEAQQQRARDLLRAARAGEAAAAARFGSTPRLSEAQNLIARELRFESWAQLKRHIAAMTREREALEAAAAEIDAGARTAIDGDLCTLHVRCGSDIRGRLREAGFRGDFYEHSYPYLIGPVREGPGCLEQRARFLLDAYPDARPGARYEDVLDGLMREERGLRDSADYERMVVWSEPDCYDQLVLLRLLSHYATHSGPRRLELVNVGRFPGAARFVGLGQLPPEALRMLWTTRRPATRAQLALGLAMTQTLDPLPGQGDLQVRDRVLAMEGAAEPVYTRRPGVGPGGEARPPWTDVLTITDLGRAVLRGETDFRSLAPPPRWVGGVEIRPGNPDWRWDEEREDTVRVETDGTLRSPPSGSRRR